uniref:DUF354 domain-containing protein n=1 Tax=Ignisphaera aggregans TaxID=334771 RepID=A0A7C5XLH9_9CREN
MVTKLWLDVLTPKQAMLFGSIYKELVSQGYNVLLTARDYDYTIATLKQLNIDFVVVGRYGHDLKSKLIEESKRIIFLLDIVESFDALVAYPNPTAARIAFGLQRPYIALTDSPHSIAPSKLSLPLASAVVISSCIPKKSIERYIDKDETYIIQFNGVDEVQWLKDFKPSRDYLKLLGLEEYGYIVVRPPEIRASYYKDKTSVIELIKKLINYFLSQGFSIVYMPRYHDDEIATEFYNARNFIIPSRDVGVKGSQLLYYAAVVVTGGGTMAREASLVGTLGISLFPQELYVDTCLQNMGFPIIHSISFSEIIEKIKDVVKDVDKYKKSSLTILQSLEKPVTGIVKALKILNVI